MCFGLIDALSTSIFLLSNVACTQLEARSWQHVETPGIARTALTSLNLHMFTTSILVGGFNPFEKYFFCSHLSESAGGTSAGRG